MMVLDSVLQIFRFGFHVMIPFFHFNDFAVLFSILHETKMFHWMLTCIPTKILWEIHKPDAEMAWIFVWQKKWMTERRLIFIFVVLCTGIIHFIARQNVPYFDDMIMDRLHLRQLCTLFHVGHGNERNFFSEKKK